jgi:hypothetical protein
MRSVRATMLASVRCCRLSELLNPALRSLLSRGERFEPRVDGRKLIAHQQAAQLRLPLRVLAEQLHQVLEVGHAECHVSV